VAAINKMDAKICSFTILIIMDFDVMKSKFYVKNQKQFNISRIFIHVSFHITITCIMALQKQIGLQYSGKKDSDNIILKLTLKKQSSLILCMHIKCIACSSNALGL
jgi:hypothetical protein